VQKLRLASGLILFTFVLTHLLNHALGIVSIAWMDAAQSVRVAVWRSVPGTVALYGAFTVHIALALYRVARRRTWRMPAWEAAQMALGLLIPLWLINHVVGTRALYSLFGVQDDYVHELTLLWPGLVQNQTILMLIVWVHGCIGLHFWLRLKRWYPTAAPWLLSGAVAVPLFASWGWISAGRRLALAGERRNNLTAEAVAWSDPVIEATKTGYIVVALVALIAVPLTMTLLRRGRGIRIAYADGRVVRTTPGPTLLEISRLGKIPHASVCGGRGRCSTCRTRILSGGERLEPPDATEARVLSRIGAAPDLRLACRVRPKVDLAVRPLFPIRETGPLDVDAERYRWGMEQEVAILFVDIRGFTALSERRYPYDVVYLLNEYLTAMSGAITGNGGYVDKFIGDAVMAIFGMSDGLAAGCREALAASGDMARALDALNATFAEQLREPLRIGIGIHAGPAVLGRVGVAMGGHTEGLTALGDTVNTASRLEGATKELATMLVFSKAVADAAKADVSSFRTSEMSVRGRSEPLTVYAADDPTVFAGRPKPRDAQRRGTLWRRWSEARRLEETL